MQHLTAINLSEDVFKLAGVPKPALLPSEGFDRYARECFYAARQIAPENRPHWFKDWALTFRKIFDDYDYLVSLDPMVAYRPINKHVEAFHRSTAVIRHFSAGNRTGKTQSGYAEHYFCVTGDHPYRPMPSFPASSLLIVGQPFSDYMPKTFTKKFLYGEDGPLGSNPLSPMFPEGGRWLYRYDAREHTIYIACIECAKKGKAGSCPSHHRKRTISAISTEKDVRTVESFTVRLVQIDEYCPEEYFSAAQMRVADSPGGGTIVTATPLNGPDAWTEEKLVKVAKLPASKNKRDPSDPKSPPLVSLHECPMYEGNIATKGYIASLRASLDDFEYTARVEGKAAAQTRNPVFDRQILQDMLRAAKDPVRGRLGFPEDVTAETADDETKMVFRPVVDADLRIWEQPEEFGQYIISVDTAAGATHRDASCATVIKMSMKDGRVHFTQVAQLHGWILMLDYAQRVYEMAIHYNSAMVIIELTGGYGRAVAESLKNDLFYWNIFRDTAKGEYVDFHLDGRFGLDTTAYNKASMVGIAQQIVKNGRFTCYCKDTVNEMAAFEQQKTDKGNAVFRGAKGAHDDRAMSVIIGLYTAVSNHLYDSELELQAKEAETLPEGHKTLWEDIHRELRSRQPREMEEWI